LSRKALVGEDETEESAADDGAAQEQDHALTMDAGDLALQREAVSQDNQASTQAAGSIPVWFNATS
jgi:hypothetical protein